MRTLNPVSVERRGQPTSAIQDSCDALHVVEDQVRAWITSCLRGALVAFLPITDDESGSDENVLAPTKRNVKGTLGKQCMADSTIVNQNTWPHEVLYTCSGEPAVYENNMAFVNGYITGMVKEPEHVKSR